MITELGCQLLSYPDYLNIKRSWYPTKSGRFQLFYFIINVVIINLRLVALNIPR